MLNKTGMETIILHAQANGSMHTQMGHANQKLFISRVRRHSIGGVLCHTKWRANKLGQIVVPRLCREHRPPSRTHKQKHEQNDHVHVQTNERENDDNLKQMFPVSIYATNYMHELTQVRPKLR